LNAIVRAAERFGLQLRESNGLMRVNRRAARPARLPEPDLAFMLPSSFTVPSSTSNDKLTLTVPAA
jgi:hypothetical protein